MKFKGVENIIKDVSNSKGVSRFLKIIFWYIVSIVSLSPFIIFVYLVNDVLVELFTKGIIPASFDYFVYIVKLRLSLLIIYTLFSHSLLLFILLMHSMNSLYFLEEKDNSADDGLLEPEDPKKNLKRLGSIFLTVLFPLTLFMIPVQIHFSDKEIDGFCNRMARHIIHEHGDELLEKNIGYSYAREECKRQVSNIFNVFGDLHFPVYENFRVIRQDKLAGVKEIVEFYTYVNLIDLDNTSFCKMATNMINNLEENDDYSFQECIEGLSQTDSSVIGL